MPMADKYRTNTLNQIITDDLAYKKQKKFHDIDYLEKKLVFL